MRQLPRAKLLGDRRRLIMPHTTRLQEVKRLLAVVSLAAFSTVAPTQIHSHGDMVGSLTADSAVVWTRSSSSADVTVIYGLNPNLSGAATSLSVRTSSSADYIAKFKLPGLRAGTRYYYRTRIANPSNASQFVLGPISRFVTTPLTRKPARPYRAWLCHLDSRTRLSSDSSCSARPSSTTPRTTSSSGPTRWLSP